MTVESATYIDGLNASYPEAATVVSDGDNHLRLVKSTIKATFPNISGAVTPTHTELNYVDGLTEALTTSLSVRLNLATTTTAKTSSFTASSGNHYLCTAAVIDDCTFPTGSTAGEYFILTVLSGSVAPTLGGQKYYGDTAAPSLVDAKSTAIFFYVNATVGWVKI